MPVTQAAIDRFIPKLAAIREITSKKMFGGLGIYAAGVFFAVLDDDRLYFKVDDGNRAFYDEHQTEEWIIQGESPQVMPYREVPASTLQNPDELASAIDEIHAASAT
jgi:DNA transformation protein